MRYVTLSVKFFTVITKLFTLITVLCCATFSMAQITEIKNAEIINEKTKNEKATSEKVINEKARKITDEKNTAVDEKLPAASSEKSNKKMVQEATINLGTTVTGNQEQPKVLYILPWQSPAPEEVDFESLDIQQKSVFRHVEREELRREMESANE